MLGIGLNLTIAEDEFPAELRDRATSLFANARPAVPYVHQSGKRNSCTETADAARVALSEALERWVEADPGTILAAWRGRDTLLGREVSWERGSGVAEGIDDRGYLLVRLADGERVALGAGDVHLTSF